jgi:hypothetical protein
MGPKAKGKGKKKVPSQPPQQPAPTNQSASASASAVATPAQGRPPPRDRNSTESGHLPSRESVRLAGLSNVDLLDEEMDLVAKQIEDGEQLQKDLADQHKAAADSLQRKRERLRRLLAVADGAAPSDASADAPARDATDATPAQPAPSRSPAEIEDIRRLSDDATVRQNRARRLESILAMSLPDDLQPFGAQADGPRSAAPDPASRKKPKTTQAAPLSSTAAMSTSASMHDDVFVTGRSLALPSPAAIENIAATYVSERLTFADTRPEYDSPRCVPGSEAAAHALVSNLRVALLNPHPTPGSISWILRHLAAAAPSQIPGINGTLVGHLLHSQAMAADVAFARADALGERVDRQQLNEMLSRSTIDFLTKDGSDPSVFLRHCIRKLQDKQNERSVKLTFLAATAAVPPVQPQPYPVQHTPPGLGFQSAPAPIPPMIGLPDQTYNQRLRRWIRYPRDAMGMVMMSACMLCGQGSLPGSVGHRADQCQATSAQRDQWIQQKIPL